MNLRTLLAFLVSFSTASLTIAAEPAHKPNILFLVADDLGYGEMGCQGNSQIPTPNIDAIAKAGIRFTDGYVTAPYCSPSRAGFMTGRYQQRFGHELNATNEMNDLPNVGLPLEQRTMADYLREAGYATGCIGKWHLGAHPPFYPQKRGFQEFYGFLREGHFYLPQTTADVVSHLRNPEPLYNRLNPIMRGDKEIEESQYLTDAIAREAIDFIGRHHAEPFFLYVPFNAVHSPMQTSHKYYDRFGNITDEHRRVFAAMLSAMDDAVGAILAKIRDSGLESETLVVFLSDNGGPTKELTSSNLPLNGGKGQLLEGGIRIPFMVQWKDHLPAGKVYHEPVISLDVLPTALAAAGSPAPSNAQLDGVNLLPFLREENQQPPHDKLFWRMGPQSALRAGNWKVLHAKGNGAAQLFDLSQDLPEQHDLAATNPAKTKELDLELTAWSKQMIEPLWGGGGKKKK